MSLDQHITTSDIAALLTALRDALGVPAPHDPAEFHAADLLLVGRNERIGGLLDYYAALPALDDAGIRQLTASVRQCEDAYPARYRVSTIAARVLAERKAAR